MTGRPTDDELREMLEARASQASPDADREAMAGLRAAMRGTPDARGAFAVLPVSTSARGGRLPGIIVASGLVAVILVAVLGGQLSAPKAASSAGVVDTGVSVPEQAAGFSADALPEVWNGAHLEGALTDQDIVGQVVVLTGTLTTSLCNPGGSCVTDIDGIAGVPVVFPYLLKAPDLVGPGTRTAMRARADGGLDYLGQLNANPGQPLTVEELLSEDSTPGRGLLVGGWLARRPADVGTQPCQAPAPSPSGCGPSDPGWMLTSTAPGVDASAAVGGSIAVTLSDDFRQGSRPEAAESTFLVTSIGGGWKVDGIVVAALPVSRRPSPSPSSTAPPVITLPVLGVTFTADELRTRLADGSLDGRLIVVDGQMQFDGRACGLRIACPIPTIDGLDGVQIDTDTEARVALQHAIPPRGPLVFVVHDSVLRYLGRQPADVDHAITVSQLMDTRIPSLIDPSSPIHELTDDPQLVSGWLVIGGTGECELQEAGRCPGPGPVLTDDRPNADGTRTTSQGVAVSLMTDPPLSPVDRVVTEGSFLVRDRSRSPAWVDALACDASEDVVCSGGQAPIQILAFLGPTSPLRSPLP